MTGVPTNKIGNNESQSYHEDIWLWISLNLNMVNTPATKKLSKVEDLKTVSNYLREPVASELLLDTTHFTEDAIQILKFHGSYQQDNRDNRVKGQEKDYSMMLRTRNPGGFIPPQLYLADRKSVV